MTLSDLEKPEDIKQLVIPDEEHEGFARVYEFNDDGSIKSVKTILVPQTVQEAEWDEGKHPRDEAGRFGSGGGGAAEPAMQEPEQPQPPQQVAVMDKQSEYEAKYEYFKALDESPTGWPPEPIHDKETEPNGNHIASAYEVLRRYPDMNEGDMITQSWQADKIRAHHEKTLDENMKMISKGLEGVGMVSGRVKSRKSMLDKLGRKRKYSTINDLDDTSAMTIKVAGIAQSEVAKEYVRQNFDIKAEDDYINNPIDDYRAHHFDIINRDGTRSELQVKTENQDKWAKYFHDPIYKRHLLPPDMKAAIETNMAVIREYGKQMSEYYYAQDRNLTTPSPLCPPIVMQILGCLT